MSCVNTLLIFTHGSDANVFCNCVPSLLKILFSRVVSLLGKGTAFLLRGGLILETLRYHVRAINGGQNLHFNLYLLTRKPL